MELYGDVEVWEEAKMEIGDSKLIEIVRKHIKINSKLLSKGREKSQIVYMFFGLAPSFCEES